MSGRSLFIRLSEDPRVLNKAWEEVHRNARLLSKGVDSITLEKYAAHSQRNLASLRLEIKAGKFEFSKLKAGALPKPNGDYRPIQVATIRDRIVQKAIETLIRKPLNEKYNLFNNPASFAFIRTEDIKGYDSDNPETFKGVRGALEKLKKYNESGYVWSLKSDIIDYFPSVDTDVLVEKYVFPVLAPDDSLNELIRKAFLQEVSVSNAVRKVLNENQLEKFLSNNGLPQGSILSPLFSNVYLTEFDNSVSDKGFILIRYVDDFLILAKTKKEVLQAHAVAKVELERLGLKIHEVNQGKTSIQENKDVTFLGIKYKGGKFYPAEKAFEKHIAKLKEYPKYSSLYKDLQSIQMTTKSWGSTYFYCDYDPALYDSLNQELVRATQRTLAKYKLKPIGRFKERELRRLGIYTFSNSVVKTRDNKLSNAIKSIKRITKETGSSNPATVQ